MKMRGGGGGEEKVVVLVAVHGEIRMEISW